MSQGVSEGATEDASPEEIPPSSSSPRASPYKGLTPFAEEDADLFFGRESEREIISANLTAFRLTVLYGASGVGKSSLLHAGVSHDLRVRAERNLERRGIPELAPVVFNAWREPDVGGALSEAVKRSVAALGGDFSSGPPRPSGSLADDLAAYAEAVGGDLLLILDQFEEYFLYHPRGDDETFDAELARAVTRPDLRANFLIAIREDALAGLDRFKARIPKLFQNYLRVESLSPEAARRAIEGPISEYNNRVEDGGDIVSIEPALVSAVIDEVRTAGLGLAQAGEEAVEQRGAVAASRQIETPFLQLVMERLWQATFEEGSLTLRRETLERLGGAAEIVRSHLNDFMELLGAEERAIAAEAFRFLVTPSKTKIAQSTSDLAYWSKREEAEVVAVLERLSGAEQRSDEGAPDEQRARILRPLPPPPGEASMRYEIFHDVLAEPLLDWRKNYEQEREKEALAKRLEEGERKRLEAQAERHKEKRNRLIRWAAGLLLILVAALAVAVKVALHEKGVARSRALAASSLANLPIDPERSILLARKAWSIEHTSQAEAALRQSVDESPLRALVKGRHELYGAVPSPNGKLVATAGQYGVRLKLWRWGSRSPVRLDPSLVGFEEENHPAAFSPDGRSILTTMKGEKTAVITRIDHTRKPVLLQHKAQLRGAAFSPDGKYVATASDENPGGATVWDARTGHRRATLDHGDLEVVNRVAFSPASNRFLLTASSNSAKARVWDWRRQRKVLLARQGESSTHPKDDGDAPALAAFSPDGKRVATALAGDTEARVWDALTGRLLFRPVPGDIGSGTLKERVLGLDWSPGGRRLVVAGSRTAQIVGGRTGSTDKELRHSDRINTVAFSPSGRAIVTASDDGTARIWSTASGTELRALRGHTEAVQSASFAGSDSQVVTAGLDRKARLWRVASGRTLVRHMDWVLDASYSRDGGRVATASADTTAGVTSLGNGMALDVFPGDEQANTARFDRAGRRVVVATEGGAFVSNARNGKRRVSLELRGARVYAAEFSPDGRQVVTARDRGTELWDADRGERSMRLQRGNQLSAAFSPNGRRVVTAGGDGVARVFDARKGRKIAAFDRQRDGINSVAFSRDGKAIVSAGFDGTAWVWKPTTGDPISTLRGHTGALSSAAFSPDGRWVVTGGADQTVRVWNAENGKPLSIERPHELYVNSVAFSPDGRSILSASDDRTAKASRCQTCGSIDAVLALAERRVTRDLTRDERQTFLGED